MDHIHLSFLTGLTTFAWVLVFGYLWRSATYLILNRSQDSPGPDSSTAKAMAFIY